MSYYRYATIWRISMMTSHASLIILFCFVMSIQGCSFHDDVTCSIVLLCSSRVVHSMMTSHSQLFCCVHPGLFIPWWRHMFNCFVVSIQGCSCTSGTACRTDTWSKQTRSSGSARRVSRRNWERFSTRIPQNRLSACEYIYPKPSMISIRHYIWMISIRLHMDDIHPTLYMDDIYPTHMDDIHPTLYMDDIYPTLWMISIRHCGLVVSAPAWDGTGCEFDSWQCRIYIPCSLSLRLFGSLRGSLGTYGLTQKLC